MARNALTVLVPGNGSKCKCGMLKSIIASILFMFFLAFPSIAAVGPPTYVSALGVSGDEINVVWYLPSGNAGTVVSYKVFRDGSQIASVNAQPYNASYPS